MDLPNLTVIMIDTRGFTAATKTSGPKGAVRRDVHLVRTICRQIKDRHGAMWLGQPADNVLLGFTDPVAAAYCRMDLIQALGERAEVSNLQTSDVWCDDQVDPETGEGGDGQYFGDCINLASKEVEGHTT